MAKKKNDNKKVEITPQGAFNALKDSMAKTSFQSAGVNGNISKNEALKIAESKNISVAQVMDRALSKGLTLGSSLVNNYNSGKLDNRSYIQKATDNVYSSMGGKPQYQPASLTNISSFGQMPKATVYGGTTSTGMPVVDMKIPSNVVRVNSIEPAGSGYGGGGTGTGGGGTGTGIGTGTGMGSGDTGSGPAGPADPVASTEEPIKPVYMSAKGDNLSGNATGFRTSKSSWKKSGKSMAGTSGLKIKPTGLASGVGLSISGRK